MVGRLMLAGLLLAACGSSQRHGRYRSQIRDASLQAARLMVMPMCNGFRREPSSHIVDMNGVEIEQPCGLIYEEISTDGYLQRFVAEVCAVPATDCALQYHEMAAARLVERYTRADFAAVKNRCTAHPFDCSLLQLELWALESHNAGVAAAFRAEARAIQADHAAAAAREQEQRRMAIGYMAAVMRGFASAGSGVDCTSTQIGNTVSTSCSAR